MIITGFHSYKGGSGKTTISINMANILAQEHKKKTIIIESDFSMPAFTHIFTSVSPDVFLNDYMEGRAPLDEIIYNLDNFDVMFCEPEVKLSSSVFTGDWYWFLEKIEEIISKLKELEYEYVIFDFAPGLQYFSGAAFTRLQHLFSVMRTDKHSFLGTNYLLDRVYNRTFSNSDSKFHLIYNQVPDLDEMNSFIKGWRGTLNSKYSFIKNMFRVNHNPKVNYYSLKDISLLPSDDATYLDIKNISSVI